MSRFKASLVSVAIATSCAACAESLRAPTNQEMQGAIVDYMSALPGFSKEDDSTFVGHAPGGMNNMRYRFADLTNNGCEKHDSFYHCDITTTIDMTVTDGGGRSDDYSAAVTRLMGWVGARTSVERGTYEFSIGGRGWMMSRKVSG